ncbi:unnamed protein product [Leptidea sinapis]|uniref:Uncharacterized protein n=1 Tax=Leptidea sinapis TaxID=189913 RepID=A0A5E4R7P6_9NEOP|nr:unnamed protein product [Leptidea sinapis]
MQGSATAQPKRRHKNSIIAALCIYYYSTKGFCEKISRDNNLEVQNVPEKKNENVQAIFLTLCKELQINLDDNDIRACRRVAKINASSNRPRNILITLVTVLSAVHRFNKSHTQNKLNTTHMGIPALTLCLTETNLNNSVFDGGDVLNGVKKLLNAERLHLESKFEDIWIKVYLKDLKWPCVCYLPPFLNSQHISSFHSSLQKILLESPTEDFLALGAYHFLIIGDFNTPGVTWMYSSSLSVLRPPKLQNSRADQLIDTMNLCNLKQFKNIPNKNNRYLDLVFSSNETIQVSGGDPLTRPDLHHPILAIKTGNKCVKPLQDKGKPCLNFHKCDFVCISKICHILTKDCYNKYITSITNSKKTVLNRSGSSLRTKRADLLFPKI